MTTTITQIEANAAWIAGNNAGNGYAVGDDGDHINEIAGLGRLVIPARADTEVAVYATDDGGALVAVGNAYGPWAVRIA